MNEQIKFDFWDSTAFRKCRDCGTVKHHDSYYVFSNRLQSLCKECYNGRILKKYARRVSRIATIKKKHGCVDCGYNKHPVALHFDHKDRSKKHKNVGDMLLGSIKKLFAEIRKCEIRCANCHAVKTHTDGDFGTMKDKNNV